MGNIYPMADDLPAVFKMDLSEREEFLSQIGSFTQEQRRIFHKICEYYDPFLDYNRFLLHAGKDLLFSNNQIEVLMRKLRHSHCGLLLFKAEEGSLRPHRIVLCDRDSKAFYQALIDDEMQRISLEDSRAWLTEREFANVNKHVPAGLFEDISVDVLGPGFIEQGRNQKHLYRMNMKRKHRILVSSSSLDVLVESSRKRINNSLKSGSFMARISRLMDMKISFLQKKLFTREGQFWSELARNIMENQNDLQERFKFLYPSLFQSCEILVAFHRNALREEEEERMDKAEREAALEKLCMDILKNNEFLVSHDKLLAMLKPYEKRWGDFQEFFYDSVVKVNSNTSLPRILCIGSMYIHKDHVYPWFRAELSNLSQEFKTYYVGLMEKMLRGRQPGKGKITVFYTRDIFRNDVEARIREESPVLAELLKKPKIVSEGIVHYFKDIKKIRDIGRIRKFMNNFFDNGMIRFKESDHLMGLYLLPIFQEAYQYLSLWRRLILRFTGRKESLISQFTGQEEHGHTASRPRRTFEPEMESPVISGKNSSPKSKRDTAFASRKHQKKQSLSNVYNSRQRKRAWMEFEDAFYRKHGN